MASRHPWPPVGLLSCLVSLLTLALLVAPSEARAQSEPQAQPRRVLLLHGESRLLPSVVLADQGVKERLARETPGIVVQTEHLDLAQVPDVPGYVDHLREFLRHKHEGQRFDAVIAAGLDAFRFAVAQRAALFPDAPLVFCGVTNPALAGMAIPADVSGVMTSPDAPQTVAAMRTLHPGLRRLLILGGVSASDRSFLHAVARNVGQPEGLQVEVLAAPTLAVARARVAALPRDAAVLFVTMLRDGANRELSALEAVGSLRSITPVPIYGLGAALVGRGIVGGRVVRFEQDGGLAAELALRLMAADASARGLRVPSPAVFMFDERELRRWGVSLASLPAGSVVVNRIPGLWQAYRRQVIGAGALVLLQAGLIGGLLLQRRRRFRAEQERRDLAGRLIVAQEDERRRIAHELHDDVQQRLASMALRISAAKAAAPDAAPALAPILEDTITLTNDLRHLSHDLLPPVLEHGGLAAALRGRLAELHEHSGMTVDLQVGGQWSEPPPDVALGLYRVAQEALQNASKHAQAAATHVSLARTPDAIVMRIVDDGRGFDAGASGPRRGLGLGSMQERVRMLAGTLSLRTAPGQGTEVRVSVPVGEQA